MLDLKESRVGVVGLARSGIGAANLCAAKGARVTVFDTKPLEALQESMAALSEGICVKAGSKPEDQDLSEMDYLVLSPAVPADLPFVLEAKKRGIPVWSEIELASRFNRGRIIGITGTNGKTTTTSLVGMIAAQAAPASKTAGNIGFSAAEIAEEVPGDAYLVLELSSFQLECIDSFHPSVAAILNFTPDHLNRHHTYEAYVEAKCRIYENQGEGDTCIFNYDDVLCREKGLALKEKAHGPRVVFFSHQVRTEGGLWTEDGHIFADINGETTDVLAIDEMKIFGPHNVENAMAGVACALAAGISLDLIRQGLRKFPGVRHRIEPVGTLDGVSYYNDSKATNPDAAIKGLLAMKSPLTVLIGGGYDKGTPYDDWCRLFDGRVRDLVLIGQTAEDIRECALKYGFPEEHIRKCETFEEAVTLCRRLARPGDSVLLSPACASWGMFDNYEQRGDIFRDLVQQMKGEMNA